MATLKPLNTFYMHCVKRFASSQALLSCTPTRASLGAFMCDFDFSVPASLETKYHLNNLLLKHQLLIFRNYDNTIISDKDLVEFTQNFGSPKPHQRKDSIYNVEYPEVFMISNVDEYGNHLGADYLPWHADLTYMKDEHIGRISILHAMELRYNGETIDDMEQIGYTLFMNCYETYNAMPGDIKNKLRDYIGMHRHPEESQNPDDTLTFHPVIRNHSVTQKPVLYVSPHFTRYIINKNSQNHVSKDSEPDDLDDILKWLFDHCNQEKFIYQHNWRLGDVLVWDNECTQHSRAAFDGDNYQRVMKRTQIYGPNSRFMIR